MYPSSSRVCVFPRITNGRSEAAVKTAKRLMSKAKESGTDQFLALLDWRNTQSEQTNQSPVQIMYGRRTRTLLPSAEALLMTPNATSAQTALTKAKLRQALYYNRGAKERPTIAVGQTVRVRFDKTSGVRHTCLAYSHTAHTK